MKTGFINLEQKVAYVTKLPKKYLLRLSTYDMPKIENEYFSKAKVPNEYYEEFKNIFHENMQIKELDLQILDKLVKKLKRTPRLKVHAGIISEYFIKAVINHLEDYYTQVRYWERVHKMMYELEENANYIPELYSVCKRIEFIMLNFSWNVKDKVLLTIFLLIWENEANRYFLIQHVDVIRDVVGDFLIDKNLDKVLQDGIYLKRTFELHAVLYPLRFYSEMNNCNFEVDLWQPHDYLYDFKNYAKDKVVNKANLSQMLWYLYVLGR